MSFLASSRSFESLMGTTLDDIKMEEAFSALHDEAVMKAAALSQCIYLFVEGDSEDIPNSILNHTWKPALSKAGLKTRSLYQTRHTFATLMLDSGETPGWVQSMMGHNSLKMILEHYYSYIKAYRRDEECSFMENTYQPIMGE